MAASMFSVARRVVQSSKDDGDDAKAAPLSGVELANMAENPMTAPSTPPRHVGAGSMSGNSAGGALARWRGSQKRDGAYRKRLYNSGNKAVGLPVRELLQHTYLIRRRQLLCEAVLFAGFIGVFFAVCFTIYDVSKAFQTNDAFIDLFLDEEFSDSNYKKNFFEVMTMEELWTWLKGPVVNGAYPSEWYNGVPFTAAEEGMVLYSSRLVGGVQLRQMRVRGNTCAVSDALRFSFPGESPNCFGSFRLGAAEFAQGTDDRSPYGPGNSFQWTDGHHFLDGLNGFGMSYGTGGYVTQLPPNRTLAASMMQGLEDSRWIDQGTRAVMVMMNFFNKQTDLVTVVRILVEIFPSGHFVKSYKFYSFQAGLYDGPLGQGRIVFEVILGIGLLYFLGKEVRQMYLSPSVTHYMRSPGNVFEMTMYVLVILCMMYYFLFLLAPDRNAFRVTDNTFRDVFAVAERYVYIFTLAGFIGLLFTLKLFRYFSVSLQMQALFNTMMRAAPDLLAFLFGFVVLVGGFAFSGTMLWGSTLAEYHNMAASFASLLRLSLGDFDYPKLAAAQPVVTGWFFSIYVTIVYLIAMNILIAIVTMYFEEVTRLLKQEEAWKQALPGFDSELTAWIVEWSRPSCAVCCRLCHKRAASSAGSGTIGTAPSASRSDLLKALAPRSNMRQAELRFDKQLSEIMDMVERQRGRSLESFMRGIYLDRKQGQQLYVSAKELEKLCSNPGGPDTDANMLRRCVRRSCPCMVDRESGMCRQPCARGSSGSASAAKARDLDPIERLLVLYAELKLVTLVGRPKQHRYALDTLGEVVDERSDWSFQDSALSPLRSPNRGETETSKTRFVVKKVNDKGVMQTRQLVIHKAEDGSGSFLLNYDRQGFLKRRMDLATLAQLELVGTDPRVLGLLFLGFVEAGGATESLLADSKDRYILVVFQDAVQRTAFIDSLQPVLDAVMAESLGPAPHPRSPSSVRDLARVAQAATSPGDVDAKLARAPSRPAAPAAVASRLQSFSGGLTRPRASCAPKIPATALRQAVIFASALGATQSSESETPDS